MDNESMLVKITEIRDNLNHHESRILALEKNVEAITDIAKSTAVMAEQMKYMGNSITQLTIDVKELKGRSAKKWDAIVDKTIMMLVAAVVGFCLSKIGLGG